MPVTLEAAAQNAVDAVDLSIINEFRTSHLLDSIPFDAAVNPAGGGATLTYTYRRETELGTAQFRAINTEYDPQEMGATSRHSVELVPLGGAFEIDRVLANIGPTATNELARQLRGKIQATQALFTDTMINGDVGQNPAAFDGLSKALAGSSTEVLDGGDWTATNEEGSFRIIDALDEAQALMDGEPGALIGNARALARVKSALRRANMYTQEVGPLATRRDYWGNIALIDAGKKAGTNEDIIPITVGKTDLYFVKFGLTNFHGVSVTGTPLITHFLPDFTKPGAVKRGEVEMGPVGVALKRTKSAAVIRDVKLS